MVLSSFVRKDLARDEKLGGERVLHLWPDNGRIQGDTLDKSGTVSGVTRLNSQTKYLFNS